MLRVHCIGSGRGRLSLGWSVHGAGAAVAQATTFGRATDTTQFLRSASLLSSCDHVYAAVFGRRRRGQNDVGSEQGRRKRIWRGGLRSRKHRCSGVARSTWSCIGSRASRRTFGCTSVAFLLVAHIHFSPFFEGDAVRCVMGGWSLRRRSASDCG